MKKRLVQAIVIALLLALVVVCAVAVKTDATDAGYQPGDVFPLTADTIPLLSHCFLPW